MTNIQAKTLAALMVLASIALFLGISSVAIAQSAGAGAVAGSSSNSGASAGAAGIVIGGPGVGGVGAQGGGRGDSISAFSPVGVGVGGSASSNASPTIVVGSGNTYEAADLSEGVPTLFVPNLTTSNGTCANSFSIGGSGPGLGLSFGKTYVSGPCNARFNANQLNALGQTELAAEVMCGIKGVADADARMAEAYGTMPRCITNMPPPDDVSTQPVENPEEGPSIQPVDEGASTQPVSMWFDDKEMADIDEMVMAEVQESLWAIGER